MRRIEEIGRTQTERIDEKTIVEQMEMKNVFFGNQNLGKKFEWGGKWIEYLFR